jgi:hypothetical protein
MISALRRVEDERAVSAFTSTCLKLRGRIPHHAPTDFIPLAMIFQRRTRFVLPCIAVLAVTDCSGDSAGPRLGARVVSGASGSDTVLAVRSDLLVVEVLDSHGQPAAGVDVQFTISPTPVAGLTSPEWRLFVCQASRPSCASFPPGSTSSSWQAGVTATTDASGVARARVQHGRVAGGSTVEIAVPSLGSTASADFETTPGNLASIAVAPADTAIYVGAAFDLNPRAADRFGNARSEPVSVQAVSPAVATFSNGRVNAVGVGRATFTIVAGTVSRVVAVSVPPRGRLLATSGAQGKFDVVLLDTDGSSRRTIGTTEGTVGYGYPDWYPDGRATTLERNHLIAIDTASGVRSAPIDTTLFSLSAEPTAPKSGTFLYFTGIRANVFGIYRANPDGSAAQYVANGQSSSASPDGTRLVYDRLTTNQIVVRDVATGVETPLVGVNGRPLWSPTGDMIAYSAQGPDGYWDLHVIRADGAGDRLLVAGLLGTSSWSPDGQWLTATPREGGLELVRASDGVRLPIAGTRAFTQVSWRP